jgi:hypothetical protein
MESCDGGSKRKLKRCRCEFEPDKNNVTNGAVQGPNPYYLVIDNSENTDAVTGPFSQSQFTFNLGKKIQGYSTCSLTFAYQQGYGNYNRQYQNFIGMNIKEFGISPINLATADIFDTVSGSGTVSVSPTFLVPRTYPVYTATATVVDQNVLSFSEAYENQYSVDVTGMSFNTMTVTLCDETFTELYYTTGGVPNYAFKCMLRFTR